MKLLRLLIADDEPLIRSGIRSALSRVPGVETVCECENGTDSIRRLRCEAIDLALLDIRMPDYSGLDIVREVGPEKMPMVVFVTAYDEYAVRAFELNAVDYLLKPFDEERLCESIERARQRLATEHHASLVDNLHALLQTQDRDRSRLERIAVHNRLGYEMVPVETIDWIEAADNYVELHCGNNTHLLNETMTNLERRLDPARFLRVHRSRMVNISRISIVAPMLNGAYEIQLQGGARLTTGRQYRRAVLAMLGRPETQ